MHFSWTAGTYIPKKEVEVVETICATIIQPNQAIRLRARKETKVRDVYLQQKMFMYENKFLLIQINKTFRVKGSKMWGTHLSGLVYSHSVFFISIIS